MREQTATQLLAAASRANQMTAFVGLDGFVDDILHVVDKRESADKYLRLPTIAQLAERLAGAAGRSTNIELVSQLNKLGGNGPIMANALASFGLQVTYLGILGYPNLHPVFADFAQRAEVHSIAEPGYTDALEFEDGKIMLGKHQSLKQMNWENIKARFGHDKFAAKFGSADLVGFVNWTMLTHMSDIWAAVLKEVCPAMKGPRRKLFIDLADPEKRTNEDILGALELITAFQKYFNVVLGLNEKEGIEVGKNLGLNTSDHTPDGLMKLCEAIHQRVRVDTLIVHPTAYALASGPDGPALVQGPFTPKPKITTGAGDHFNSGFCLGKLLGLPTDRCLLTGVATSGFYVRTGQSPTIPDLAKLLQKLARLSMPLIVVKYGTPVLRQKGARIESITPMIKKLAADMLETTYAYKGIGLAAQQVGFALQLTVIDVRGVTDRPSSLEVNGKPADVSELMPLVLLNPELKPVGQPATGPEGCLSFPEIYADITRPDVVDVKALNLEGKPLEFRCGGLLARVIQHETDHLNGILFIDRMDKKTKEELRIELDDLMVETKALLKG